MPRSHGVLKVEVWEAISDFRHLTMDGQWAYAMLISQPEINNLGVLPYVPDKWARLAADLTRERLQFALGELESVRYTITDVETSELLVRTFIKHDSVWKQPRLVKNARRLIRTVESEAIRSYLAERHPWLVDETWTDDKIAKHETRRRPSETPRGTRRQTPPDTTPETPPETPSAEAVDNPPERGVSEGVSEGVSLARARAHDGLGLPLGLPQPQPPSSASTAEAEDVAAQPDSEQPATAAQPDTPEPGTLEPNRADPLVRLVTELRDADAGTHHALHTQFGGLPEAAFAYTREEILRCRTEGQVSSEAGLATRILQRIADTGLIGDPDHDPTPTAQPDQPTLTITERAQQLWERTRDAEAVADWLAGITRLTTHEREHILAQVTT